MAMRTLILITGAAFVLSCTSEASTPKHGSRTVVLELFTSQGCSSCPPADRLLSKLRTDDFAGRTVIPLAYHVDYWNHLGWRDPFSSAQWSNRQRAYAQAMRSSQVFTPQLVINGKESFVGSAESAIRAAIDRQLERDDQGTIAIEKVTRDGNTMRVDVRATTTAKANVVVVLFENGITTDVRSGENANHRLTDDAIVRWEGNAAQGPVAIPLDPAWKQIGVAAFLQDPKSLEIYASTAWKSPAGN
jgi:hypothetical protein